jgi:hypothetical protein
MSEEKSLTKKEIIVTGANSEIKVFDEQLKKYRKKYVNEYIAKLNSHYCEIIEANNRDFAALGERYNELVDTYNELLAEHNKLSTSYIALQGEKASVAQALIDAQNTGIIKSGAFIQTALGRSVSRHRIKPKERYRTLTPCSSTAVLALLRMFLSAFCKSLVLLFVSTLDSYSLSKSSSPSFSKGKIMGISSLTNMSQSAEQPGDSILTLDRAVSL